MKRLLDHNPLTGESVTFDYKGDSLTITHSQDVQANLDYAAEMRQDVSYSDNGIKDDMWHYAHLPPIIVQELKEKHGVSMTDMNDRPKLFHLLETEYSRFKMTNKSHLIKHG